MSISLEERGMRLSRPKTQFMDFNFEKNQQGNREPVKILGEELERVTHFKYLGTSMEEEGGMETEIAKYWTESGQGDGQGDVEKKDHQSYRRPYMMGKARGKVSKSMSIYKG